MVAPFEWPSQAERKFLRDACVAFGVFDGVHEGHRYLIDAVLEEAGARGLPMAIVTFDRDPDDVFHVAGFHKLMTDEARLKWLASLAGNRCVVVPFTSAVASMAPEDFLARLAGENTPASMHVGAGFRYGFHCAGDAETLRTWGKARGMDVFVHDLLTIDDQVVSSTEIRRLLSEGEVGEATRLLGRPYRLEGSVVHGRAEGQTMGIKTANLQVPELLLAVAEGVYGCYATVDGRRYRAAVSVGVAPTFERARANVEVHLLDFDGDIYDRRIAVDFIAWLRPMLKFESVDELVATINANIDWVRTHL